MSAIKGTIGEPGSSVQVSVGDGGTVYLTFSDNDEWFFSPPDALKLSELVELAARHYDADHRTLAEQTQDHLARLTSDLQDTVAELEASRTVGDQLRVVLDDLIRWARVGADRADRAIQVLDAVQTPPAREPTP